ncbi:MAG TPA: hypothetical protein VFQ45_19025 [Longimicrobium sp.]|nr:hypothetical protein [Longimicrobium sp.]
MRYLLAPNVDRISCAGIAAQTVALGYTLVTDNEREFTRIAELRVENWLR